MNTIYKATQKTVFFILLALCIALFETKDSHASPVQHIKTIIEAVKNHGSGARGTVASVARNGYNYDYFFSKSVPHLWSTMNTSEKNKVISSYNQKCVNQYFGHLLNCAVEHYDISDQGSKISLNYKCQGTPKTETIRFVVHGGKIADIQYGGLSFLRTQGGEIKMQFASCPAKDEFIDQVCR